MTSAADTEFGTDLDVEADDAESAALFAAVEHHWTDWVPSLPSIYAAGDGVPAVVAALGIVTGFVLRWLLWWLLT